MYESAARNLRTTERFLVAPPLPGQFGSVAVSVCDISAKGARFTHNHSLEMGDKAILRLAIDGRPTPVALEAVIVWIQPDPVKTNRFVSGVRTYAPEKVVSALLHTLQAARRLTPSGTASASRWKTFARAAHGSAARRC